jgi:hypothetical protein
MKVNNYSKLKKELLSISKLIKQFPEQVQPKVLDILVRAYLGEECTQVGNQKEKGINLPSKTKLELPDIATFNEKGDFILTVRDVKASSQADAVKRLTYVAIRSYLKLKSDETKVSRQKIINPILSKWRVYDGNARLFLANDRGIIRENGLLSLDIHATKEADEFIKDIIDPKKSGSWSPGSVGARKRSKAGKRDK